MAAIEAFKRRPVKKKMERMMRRARTWFRLPDGDGEAPAADGDSIPQLKVTRAPEVDDLRWENLDLTIRIKGEEWPRLSHPLALMRRNAAVLVAVFLLWTSFNIILRLTADKIELKETQTISTSPAADPCKHCLPTDDFFGHGLEMVLQKVLLYFGFDVYGEHRLSAEAADHAVTTTAFFIAVTIFVVNKTMKVLLSLAVGLERHRLWSQHTKRVMTLYGILYIFNYVVVLFVVHSPWVGSRREDMHASVREAWDAAWAECEGEEGEVRWSCTSGVLGMLWNAGAAMYESFMVSASEGFDSNSWYDEAGLVPQIITIAVVDLFMLCVAESIKFTIFLFKRFMGRMKFAQSAINLAYAPPEFIFAEKYGYMLKIAAPVLVFAPAAPILYFACGVSLLWAFFVQKTALVKIYARPRTLDESVAERARDFLSLLAAMHVCTSCLFYVRAWLSAAGDRANLLHELRPFTTAFVVLLVYYIAVVPLSKFGVTRSENEEETGADDRLYQEVCDAESETLGAQGKWSYRVPAPLTPTEMARRPSQILKHGAGAFFAGAAVGLAETSSKSMV
jgi:hypothetical protein